MCLKCVTSIIEKTIITYTNVKRKESTTRSALSSSISFSVQFWIAILRHLWLAFIDPFFSTVHKRASTHSGPQQQYMTWRCVLVVRFLLFRLLNFLQNLFSVFILLLLLFIFFFFVLTKWFVVVFCVGVYELTDYIWLCMCVVIYSNLNSFVMFCEHTWAYEKKKYTQNK